MNVTHLLSVLVDMAALTDAPRDGLGGDPDAVIRRLYSRYAKATFRKDRRLNIRLSSKDLEAIQKRALAEGLPYQTLISSVLHKYASGRLKEA